MRTERRGSKMLSREEKKSQKEFQGKKIAAKLGCPWGTMACGVFGGSRKAWECVDTANDLESCESFYSRSLMKLLIFIALLIFQAGAACFHLPRSPRRLCSKTYSRLALTALLSLELRTLHA